MGTKMAVAFANMFMTKIERKKKYSDIVPQNQSFGKDSSMWNTRRFPCETKQFLPNDQIHG